LKFIVEICATADDGAEIVVHRTTVAAISPRGARKEAYHLLTIWKRRKAKSIRVLNAQGETLFSLNE
jgi:glucosamine 6-phosphate synthetase-like amidotransferase/phosphosugar isomerase protein